MGKIKWLEIAFDGDIEWYFSGDLIRGQVLLEIEDTGDGQGIADINGIWVRFRGKAKTKFTPRNDDTSVSSKEHYFDNTLDVYGTGDQTLLPGRHVFPFEFQVPNDQGLPQSFEGRYGYVRYKVKVTVSRSKTFYNKKYKEEKWIKLKGSTVDLSLIPNIEEAEYKETAVPVSCCRCADGDYESIVSLGLPRQGFLPAENIYVICHVDNRTADENMEFWAMFIQQITYKAKHNHSRIKNVTLSEPTNQVGCPKGRITEFTLGPLVIPSDVVASDFPGCNLIDVNYSVKISCRTLGCKDTFPVMIGTVRSEASYPPLASTASPLNAMEGSTGLWQTQTAHDLDCPPPSYDEVVGNPHYAQDTASSHHQYQPEDLPGINLTVNNLTTETTM